MVPRVDSAAHSSPMGDPQHNPEERPPFPGERDDLATLSQTMGPPARVLNTICEARAPSTRRLYALGVQPCIMWSTTGTFISPRATRCRPYPIHAPSAQGAWKGSCCQSLGKSDMIVRLRGARRLNLPRYRTLLGPINGPQSPQRASIRAATIRRIEATLAQDCTTASLSIGQASRLPPSALLSLSAMSLDQANIKSSTSQAIAMCPKCFQLCSKHK